MVGCSGRGEGGREADSGKRDSTSIVEGVGVVALGERGVGVMGRFMNDMAVMLNGFWGFEFGSVGEPPGLDVEDDMVDEAEFIISMASCL